MVVKPIAETDQSGALALQTVTIAEIARAAGDYPNADSTARAQELELERRLLTNDIVRYDHQALANDAAGGHGILSFATRWT